MNSADDTPLFLECNSIATFDGLVEATNGETGTLVRRRFPDGESYLRVDSDVAGRHVVVAANLSPPDPELFPLFALADALHEMGASRIDLVAPYLPYMRQDHRFRAGEAITSTTHAGLISKFFDALLTVDPHLHRYTSLGEVYSIPSLACRAAPRVSAWIQDHVSRPVIIGPDAESEQWVATVADPLGAPWTVLEKIRRGDRDVDIAIADVARYADHQPVLLDDIISTGMTMIETIGHLSRQGLAPPICIGIHGVFAGDAYQQLLDAGAERIVTTNTLSHPSNAIDLTSAMAEGLRQLWDK